VGRSGSGRDSSLKVPDLREHVVTPAVARKMRRGEEGECVDGPGVRLEGRKDSPVVRPGADPCAELAAASDFPSGE